MAREFKNSRLLASRVDFFRVESSRVRIFQLETRTRIFPSFLPRVEFESSSAWTSRVEFELDLNSTQLEKLETYVTYIFLDKSLAGLFVRYYTRSQFKSLILWLCNVFEI